MKRYKIIKFSLGKDFKFTGRELSTKLVISKNIDSNGNKTTLVLSKRKGKYFFQPVSDIYYDYNNTELIIPKFHPVFVAPGLYRDIIASTKYNGHFVFSPESDFETIFKEIEIPNGDKLWCVVYETITLHKYCLYDNLREFEDCREDELYDYLSTHQIKSIKREKAIERAEYERQLNLEYRKMTEELFEEAGYDFMD